MQIVFKHKKPDRVDETYDIDEGAVIIENYNETLDSAVIRLSHLTTKLDIEPFDDVILQDTNTPKRFEDKYMCVDTYTETMESLDPYIYTYELHLFSETKELEGIVLPNLSITSLKGQTSRKVKYYLFLYLSLYGPKIRRQYSGYYDFISKYGWSQETSTTHPSISDKFDVDCPEFQWNQPTLREVLTDLMMVVDCIPVVKNDKIDYIDLSQKNNPIVASKVNYIQSSQSSEDYVSELKMDMQNVMQKDIDGVDTVVTKAEYFPLTADDDSFLLNDKNRKLKTQLPILNVKHLYIGFFASVELSDAEGQLPYNPYYLVIMKDLCNIQGKNDTNVSSMVCEYKEFITKKVARNLNDIDRSKFETMSQYQNLCLYFNRGGNELLNFEASSKTDGSGVTYALIRELINEIASLCTDDVKNSLETKYGVHISNINGQTYYEYYNPFFKIEYETLSDSVFTASKGDYPNNHRTVVDNQTNSYVDAYKQGFIEYQKANRLGNKQLLINARYENNYGNITKIGDYYEDNIIYQVQYQIFEHHIEVNALATKDYILKNYFTGVKAKIRSWKIAEGSDALIRHELNKFYIEFSKSSKNECFTPANNYLLSFTSPLKTTSTIKPWKYCIVKTLDTEEAEYPEQAWKFYALDLSKRIIGNSIVFSFGFEDNYQAGVHYQSSEFTIQTYQITNKPVGGVPLYPLRYVDDNGEFISLNYSFTDDINIYSYTDNIYVDLKNGFDCDGVIVTDIYGSIYDKPVTNLIEVIDNIRFTNDHNLIYKDNKEILKMSTQFEFCSDTHDIVFTKKFLELQQCVRELSKEELTWENGSFITNVSTSDWGTYGGLKTFTATISNPSLYPMVEIDGVAYYRCAWEHIEDALYQKTMSNYTISATSAVPNTINFDNNYSYFDAVHQEHHAGRFYGYVYTTSNQTVSATVTYTTTDSPAAYWDVTKSYSVPSLIGADVEITNVTISGVTVDTYSYNFNQYNGEFTIRIKTYFQPTSTTIIGVTYKYRLSNNSSVANPITIYQQTSGELDFKRPSLVNATATTLSLSFDTVYTDKCMSVTVEGATVGNDNIFYIVQGTDKNDDNILVAFKGGNTFYMNLLKDRNPNIYDIDGNIIDTI